VVHGALHASFPADDSVETAEMHSTNVKRTAEGGANRPLARKADEQVRAVGCSDDIVHGAHVSDEPFALTQSVHAAVEVG